jgi:membrane-associated protein
MPHVLGLDIVDPEHLLETFGTIGLFLIIFAESGLLFGFFLPGDSLLFLAGALSSDGRLAPLPVLLVGCFVAAVAGDQVGYVFGKKVGPSIFKRPDSRFFHHRHVERAQEFFDEHGPKTIVLARFVPVVRTFAPILAGVGKMQYRTFVSFNILGGLLWAVGITTAGYLLGSAIDIDKYLLPVIAVIILLSVLPVAFEYRKQRKARAASRAEGEAGAVATELGAEPAEG